MDSEQTSQHHQVTQSLCGNCCISCTLNEEGNITRLHRVSVGTVVYHVLWMKKARLPGYKLTTQRDDGANPQIHWGCYCFGCYSKQTSWHHHHTMLAIVCATHTNSSLICPCVRLTKTDWWLDISLYIMVYEDWLIAWYFLVHGLTDNTHSLWLKHMTDKLTVT